ncbi:MAG: HAMP domain-containing sensor histidine kinase [Bdellovibrio sp.]
MKYPRRTQLILLSLGLIVAISWFSYIVVDFYIKSTATAVIESWLESEAVNLQQENYLSSVAKSQRILLSSEFINGLHLVKVEPRGTTQLIQIGKVPHDISWSCPQSRIEAQTAGLFSYRFLHCFEKNPEMRISFFSENPVFTWIFLSVILIISLFLTALISIMIALHKREVVLLETISDISRQVAHDIRSPLSALKIASSRLQSSSPEASIIRDASEKIDNIAEDLLQKSKHILALSKSDDDEKAMVSLKVALEQVAGEKLLQYPHKIVLDISPDSNMVKIKADQTKLYRAISNLLNNALEAIEGQSDGVVTLGLRRGVNQAQMIFIDNGKGIPPEILSNIGKQGFTFGKNNGNGLGFSSAKSFIEAADGTLSISSTIEAGTIVTMTFKNIAAKYCP